MIVIIIAALFFIDLLLVCRQCLLFVVYQCFVFVCCLFVVLSIFRCLPVVVRLCMVAQPSAYSLLLVLELMFVSFVVLILLFVCCLNVVVTWIMLFVVSFVLSIWLFVDRFDSVEVYFVGYCFVVCCVNWL